MFFSTMFMQVIVKKLEYYETIGTIGQTVEKIRPGFNIPSLHKEDITQIYPVQKKEYCTGVSPIKIHFRMLGSFTRSGLRLERMPLWADES